MEKQGKRRNIAIRDDVHRQLKIRAVETRKTMAEIVEAALRHFLAQPRS